MYVYSFTFFERTKQQNASQYHPHYKGVMELQ